MSYIIRVRNKSGTIAYQERERYRDNTGKWRERVVRHLGTSDKEYKRYLSLKETRKRQTLGKFIDKSITTSVTFSLKVSPGEWWHLGKHFLYCGDTSTPEFIKALPEAPFAFADPPYNAGLADWDSDFIWRHDWLIEKAKIVIVTPGLWNLFDFARETKMPYQWSIACWISNGMTTGRLGFGNWIYAAVFSQSSVHRNSQDFLKVAIDNSTTGETDHKGRKPSQYMLWLLKLFTKVNDIVIDPFLGSGTTLLVAENIGRICYGGELNPEYCAEIITRWEQATNKKAVRVKNVQNTI